MQIWLILGKKRSQGRLRTV